MPKPIFLPKNIDPNRVAQLVHQLINGKATIDEAYLFDHVMSAALRTRTPSDQEMQAWGLAQEVIEQAKKHRTPPDPGRVAPPNQHTRWTDHSFSGPTEL